MPVEAWSDRIWLAPLPPEPLLTDDLDNLAAALRKADPTPDVVLDLSAVPMLHSTALSRLLTLRKSLLDGAARLRLTAPNDRVWTVFLTTGLDQVFRFSENTATALAELQLPD